AGGASIIHAGAVEEKQWEVLFSNFQQALANASKRQGDRRTAAGGNQGHQRTPAMISALLKDAKAALDGDGTAQHLPAGGFTDVGLHTGGSPRDTAWSLAREQQMASSRLVLIHIFGCRAPLEVLFALVMADLHLSVLEHRLRALSGGATDVNEGMEMLGFCSQLGRVLIEDGHTMPGFVRRIEKARERLDGVQAEQAVAVAARFQLLPVNESPPTFEGGEPRLPIICLPSPLRHPSTGTGALAEAKLRSSQNLKSL
ncbi:unnamed protein product, partial [Ectocarpus sp. 8 AP-2014]